MGGNVFALPKLSYRIGEPVELHLSPRHTSGWKTSSAWPSRHPLNCSLVAQKGNKDKIRLRLQYDDSTKPLTEAQIQSGGTIAFIIQRRDRTLQLLLVHLFTQEAEPSDARADWK